MNKEIYPVHLRLELKNEWCDEEEKRILTKYVDANKNCTFVRDILIASDMPLHNFHLRCSKIDEKDFERLTHGRVKEWMERVGALFLGPYRYGGYKENYEIAQDSIQNMIEKVPELEVRESFNDHYERTKDSKKETKEPIRILKYHLL